MLNLRYTCVNLTNKFKSSSYLLKIILEIWTWKIFGLFFYYIFENFYVSAYFYKPIK